MWESKSNMADSRNPISQFRKTLKTLMHSDTIALRRELDRLLRSKKRMDEAAFAGRLAGLESRLQVAAQRKRRRLQRVPRFEDLLHLPISEAKNDIIESLKNHPVTIISGETGSGKTTQIPKFCLAAGRGIDGKIACTQPRRIAATTVAARIAEELGEELGRSVGYKIRFQDTADPDAYIKVVTDGILLAETQGDPWLNEYDTIIVDEAHERSLNIDFVLGILKRLVERRHNLKLVITSATIDTEKFSKAFDYAPVIEVSGRLYPVETRYFVPDTDDREEPEERTSVDLAAQAIDQLSGRHARGDVLVFMPTEQDIRETCETLEGRSYPRTVILPLFARLSQAEQKRVFASTGWRKIIVATNVAETSITIPGIKYVVDTGLARISQYVPRSRTTSLPVVPISRSSADQRKGRCGRVQNGICIRLFSEEDYQSRPLFTQPEILRANLADVILRMISLKLGDIDTFPFIDRPAEKSIRDGFNLLEELGAIWRPNARKAFGLTDNGRIMARMPIDPRLSRMLIEAQKENCLAQVTVIAAALSIQDVRERPLDKENLADQAHRPFVDPLSDFITILNLWTAIHHGPQAPRSMNALKKFCRQHFLSFRRIREWRDIHNQITAVLKEQGMQTEGIGVRNAGPVPDAGRADDGGFHPLYAAIHRAILSGFLSNIALKKEKVFFRAAKEREVMIFPGSGLFKNPGDWIVAAEMVETSRLFARKVATIDVGWLEPLGGDLCRRSWSDPHWARSRGEVVAREQVSLFGLPIVEDRQVAFGRIDPAKANEIFIRSALIEMDVREPLGFMRHNAELVADVRNMEDRIRRRDILVDDAVLVAFYQERLPGVCDMRTLKYRIRKKGGDGFLRLNKDLLTRYLPEADELEQFPQQLDLGHRVLECDYAFEPGEESDGVTLTVPLETTGDVPREQLDWLVPGLLAEKITALIKGLPKAHRVQLVPVADTVDLLVREMPRGRESLPTALSRFLFSRLKVDIPASAWPVDALPDHLKMRLSITDTKGRVVASGRDESLLDQQAAQPRLPKGMQALKRKWERQGITDWDFGDLPDVLTVDDSRGTPWRLYPRLTVINESIGIRLLTDSKTAHTAHLEGVAALLSRRFAEDLKYLKKSLKLPALLKRQVYYFGGMTAIEAQMVQCVTQTLFAVNLLTQQAFDDHVAKLIGMRIHQSGEALRTAVIAVIEAHHEARCRILEVEKRRITAPLVVQFLQTLGDELTRLVPENFVFLYDRQRLGHLVRYLKAISIRVQRGLTDLEKDRLRQGQVAPFLESLNQMLTSMDAATSNEKRSAVEAFFWMIEEYKVSLFAQEVGTDGPVSPKRLNKLIGEIERMR
ncbi:HrpA: ATP-dependent RNA helicase [Desulfosarcina variabilis str. Montpellier]|uniref:ATP-dependent RNA helicase HrpA n=1 Tax=Desulfosarcina variabilis TaxID=2300 RepID=UPI003AFB773B